MAIGDSNGNWFEDEFSMLAAQQPSEDLAAKDDAFQSSLVPISGFNTAKDEMGLNEQEQNLYMHHLKNLVGSGGVDNEDGTRSTIFQAVEPHDGKFYNIPTVWDGKIETQPYTRTDGTIMQVPNQTAIDNVEKAGWDTFPSYTNDKIADDRYMEMHKYMEQDTTDWQEYHKPSRKP